ncbi:MAG: helix-turn-helix transcriptional regulator [Clostridiales bacterium]|jgi:transcriptional regulator with XRE-family HTH domain|nr:helix-turn-helix transcriptional regulator [Clostridiales bacterium]NLL87282.1 helix-turn-helix transcriptional regulator [Syntrophomonadaceae bacterium]
MSVFPPRLRMVLAERKMKQKQLAMKLGISDRTVNSYCNGKSFPSLSILAQICTILNVSADFLIGARDDFRHLEGTTDEISNDILMIRRSYASMTDKERELIRELVHTLTKS